MDHAKIQKCLSALIDVSVPQAGTEDKERILRFVSRIVSSSFSEELDSGEAIQVQVARIAREGRQRVFDLLGQLNGKRSLARRDQVIKALLKIAEGGSMGGSSFFAQVSGKQSLSTAVGSQVLSGGNMSGSIGGNSGMAGSIGLGGGMGGSWTGGGREEESNERSVRQGLVSVMQAVQSDVFAFEGRLDMFVVRPKFEDKVSASAMCALNQMAELGWLYLRVTRGTEALSRRLVSLTSQALISGVQDELAEFYRFLVGLAPERGDWISFSATAVLADEQFVRMKYLAMVLDACPSFGSAEMLSLLFRLAEASFIERQTFLRPLLLKAARPFAEFLSAFVASGEIVDPMSEFFVRSNASCPEQKLWLEGLSFESERVPCFLQKDWAATAFSAGRAARTLRKVGAAPARGNPPMLDELLADAPLHGLVKLERENAKLVLELVIKNQRLIDIALTVKDLLFTRRGDLFNAFIEALDVEVGLKNLAAAARHQLNSCLDSALKASVRPGTLLLKKLAVGFFDPEPRQTTRAKLFDLFFNFAPTFEPLVFPLNNVLSSETTQQARTCFRYIISLKAQQYELKKLWNLHSKRHSQAKLANLLTISGHLRLKMQAFANGILHYWLIEVIEKQWTFLVREVESATSLDNVISAYSKYSSNICKAICFEGTEEEKSENYSACLFEILSMVNKFKDSQEVIFQTLKENLNFEDSYDSIDRIEDPYIHEIVETNEAYILEATRSLININIRWNEEIAELLNIVEDKSLAQLLDFNEFYTIDYDFNSKLIK